MDYRLPRFGDDYRSVALSFSVDWPLDYQACQHQTRTTRLRKTVVQSGRPPANVKSLNSSTTPYRMPRDFARLIMFVAIESDPPWQTKAILQLKSFPHHQVVEPSTA